MMHKGAFQLAQTTIELPGSLQASASALPEVAPSISPGSAMTLINLSALFLVIPIGLLLFFVGYIVLNSPAGAPLFKKLAESAFRKKQFSKAARHYTKLHVMQELLEGNVYARKAALSFEHSGNLREAMRWYEKAEDWAKLGQLLLDTGASARAIEVFREHDLPSRLALAYEKLENHLEAGKVYQHQLQNLHKAETSFKRSAASADKETSLEAKLLLASVYHLLSRGEEAQATLAEVRTEIDSSAQYQEFPDLLKLQSQVESQLGDKSREA